MLDLFGDNITAPVAAGLQRRALNAAHGFDEFWKAWPPGPRKVAKQQCLNKWAVHFCAEQASHIVAHVNWMKDQPDWLKDRGGFIPQPLTYLNQQRWIDWDPPVLTNKKDVLAEIKAHVGAAPSPDVKAKIKELLGRRAK